jgi:hypothetical protein
LGQRVPPENTGPHRPFRQHPRLHYVAQVRNRIRRLLPPTRLHVRVDENSVHTTATDLRQTGVDIGVMLLGLVTHLRLRIKQGV